MKSTPNLNEMRWAFTRAELLVIVAVTLLALVVLPALANTRPRSARVICANNLRQIGGALQLWGNDHDDQPPWEVTTANGGTQIHALGGNVWFQFVWMTNELVTPKILFCPSDTGRPALDFGNSPNIGYLHPNMRNNATSYSLSHAFNRGVTSLIATDRNIGNDTANAGGCNRFGPTAAVYVNPIVSPRFQWNNNLHQNAGNILRLDGRVEQHSNETLRKSVETTPLGDGGNFQSIHLIYPR